MRAKEWTKLSAPLAGRLTGFRPIEFGFVREREWVAECLTVNTSAFSKEAFYMEAFPLPLFIPTDTLYFNYGFRIGQRWVSVGQELEAAVVSAIPRLETLATLRGLWDAARSSDFVRDLEVRVCIALLTGDLDLMAEYAGRMFERPWSRGWEVEVVDRVRTLQDRVMNYGPDSGGELLAEYRTRVRELLK